MSDAVKAIKGEEAYRLLAEKIFDLCTDLLNMKLTEVTTKAAFNAGLHTVDCSNKPGVFTMHDGVSVGDGIMLHKRLMEGVLAEIVSRHVTAQSVRPFEAIKEFAQLVDGITFEFI